jgi:hypothetical protein
MATIGNSLTGANDRIVANQIWKGILIPSFPGGTINSARAVLQATDGTWRMVILNASTGAVLASSATRTDISSFTNYTFTFSTPSVAAGDIILAVGADSQATPGFAFYNDSDTYDGQSSDNFYAVDPIADPIGMAADSTRDYSMDLDYTPAGGSSIAAIQAYYARMRAANS